MPRSGIALLVVVMLALVRAAAAEATLNPGTYVSPSGQYELFVDPTEMNGAGEGRYRLTRDGEVAWSATHPVTLWDAVVTDRGEVAGYAYEAGYGGRVAGLQANRLWVVIFDPEGVVRMRDMHPRQHPSVLSTPPAPYEPLVAGILVDPRHDRFIVRIPPTFGRADEQWWMYELSTGEVLDVVTVDQPEEGGRGFHRAVDVRLVPDAPLALVHWYIFGYEEDVGRIHAARFALLTFDGKELWRHESSGEYAGIEDFRWYSNLVERAVAQIETKPGGFAVRSLALGQRIEVRVEHGETGWEAVEIGRVDEIMPVTPAEPDPPPVLPPIELEALGVIHLENPGEAANPISSVVDFQIDDAGRIGLIRARGRARDFVLVDRDGDVQLDVPLPMPEHARNPHAVPLGGDRWLVVQSSYRKDPTLAWRLDAATGVMDPLGELDCGGVEAIVPAADGGFVVLAKIRLEFTGLDDVIAFDADGRKRWNVVTEGYGRGYRFKDVVTRPGGGVAALCAVHGPIVLFDDGGVETGTIDLRAAIGHRPRYVSSLSGDAAGGLVLRDSSGDPPVHVLASGGRRVASFRPRFEDGRTFQVTGHLRRDPDGALWTSNRHALLQLDDEGVVTRIIGQHPDSASLDEVKDLVVGFDGLIYALNGRTASVHVFDTDGRQGRVLVPEPTDFPTVAAAGQLTVSGVGDVYLSRVGQGTFGQRMHLVFGGNGERVGFERLDVYGYRQQWIFQPGREQVRWVIGHDRIYLVDLENTVLKEIRRRPDRNWLDSVHAAAMAPDGSLAVISSSRTLWSWRGPAWLSVYEADGTPRFTEALTVEQMWASLFWNGCTAITIAEDGLVVRDIDAGTVARMTLDDEDAAFSGWALHGAPDGSELWLRVRNSREIQRYRVP